MAFIPNLKVIKMYYMQVLNRAERMTRFSSHFNHSDKTALHDEV